MKLSKRNRKVAVARWKKTHTKEIENIPKDKKSLVTKAAICGFLAGDGSVQKRKEKNYYHHQIDFFPDDRLMRDTYIKQIKQLYHKTPSVRKKNKFYSVRISSKTIYKDLNNHAKFGLKNWVLPKELFGLEGAKQNWLRAFFSAEAYVNKKCIKVQTVNKKGMKEISKVLNGLGIHNSYYEYNSIKKSESPVFIIHIRRKESMLNFYNTIGFWHEKKSKVLKEALGL